MARVSAPASSGNLGPGFDAIALALELRCAVTAELADTWSVRHVGPEPLPGEAQDLVLLAAQKAVGDRPLRLIVANEVPLSRGLGSSSAAAAAGAAAAVAAVEGSVDSERVFDLVTEFEGHADNSGAAVYGGLIGVDPDGGLLRLEISDHWRVVVAIPGHGLSTAEARAALPPIVDRTAVVRSLGRVMALVEGLRTGDAAILRRAAGDELHQTARAHLHPAADTLIEVARSSGAAHAAWSGAGPSVICFVEAGAVHEVRPALEAALGPAGSVAELAVAVEGLIHLE